MFRKTVKVLLNDYLEDNLFLTAEAVLVIAFTPPPPHPPPPPLQFRTKLF